MLKGLKWVSFAVTVIWGPLRMNLHSEATYVSHTRKASFRRLSSWITLGRLHSEDFIRGLQNSEYIYYNNTTEETKLNNKYSNGIVLTIRCQDHLNSPK